ncbi:MAG: mRNA interferase HigB [Saprospiraceae bacterium]|jgi:mRNA interferase HigB
MEINHYICNVKVNLVKWVNVLEIVKSNPEMKKAFIKFYLKLKTVEWKHPNDVLKTFNSADILKCTNGNRIIFNLGGNKYRLICGYYFGVNTIHLFVKFVGTHKQYDRIEACKIEMFKR